MRIRPAVLFCLCMPTAFAAAAALPPVTYDNVTLATQGTVKSSNDLLRVELYLEERGKDPAALADRANMIMTQALHITRRYPTVQARSGNYQTAAEYRYDDALKKSVMTGWRIHQDLDLESRDMPAVKQLTGELQQTLKVGSMNFSVSPAARQAAENEAIRMAMDAFRQRARLVQTQLGASGYRIRTLDVSTEEPHRIYPLAGAMRMDAAAPAPVTPPEATPGQSEVTARVSGTIHLTH